MIHRLAWITLVSLMIFLALALIIGWITGTPAIFAFVESDSMEPTLEEGDGYIAIPSAIAGEVGVGDVVLFETEHIHEGDPTTHRIIDDRGGEYITQGDNNPFHDQSRGEPPITDGQISAVALQFDGQVIRIPQLGTGVQLVGSSVDWVERSVASLLGTQRLGSETWAYILFGLGMAFIALSAGVDRFGNRRDRKRTRSRIREGVFSTTTIIAVCVCLVVVAASMAMLLPAGTQSVEIISSQGDSDRPDVIEQGTTSTMNYTFGNGGLVPVISFYQPASAGVDVEPQSLQLQQGDRENVTMAITAPDDIGLYTRSFTEYRYLMVLPPALIEPLHQTHPWLPYLVINGLLGSIVIAVGLFLREGSTNLRIRSRKRKQSTRWFP